MKLQQFLLNHYLHVEFEEFSAKAIEALGILVSIKNNPLSDLNETQEKRITDSMARVKEIIEITDENTQVGLFILDRNIIPQDLQKNNTNYITNFTRKREVKGEKTLKLNQDQIQSKLFHALLEIHTILMHEIAAFSDQIYFEEQEL